MQRPKHIVLLGASVGKAWHIEELPQRTRIEGYRFEYVGQYQFDKSDALQQILGREKNKPDAIFIKECAAYFPGDISNYQKLMEEWVEQCRQARTIPIPTTVVSIIRDHTLKTRIKDIIKKLIGRPTATRHLEGIIQYNDRIKSYAQKEGLGILDLEAPLRTALEDRSLRLDLHSGDGLHLNKKAYELLDQIVLPTLSQISDQHL